MAYIMQYDTWIKGTELRLKPRSKYLKGVDNALKDYHQTKADGELKTLKIALHQWKMFKGYDSLGGRPAWVSSDRNRSKAVEQLDLQVFGYQGALDNSVLADLAELPFYGIESWVDDGEAKRVLRQARKDALVTIFDGKTVGIKKAALGLALMGIKKKISEASADASKTGSVVAGLATQSARTAIKAAIQPTLEQAEKIARDLINEVLSSYPVEVAQEVLQQLSSLIPGFLLEVAHSIIPYLSLGVSAGMTLKNTVQAVMAEYSWVKVGTYMDAFDPGNPYAAAVAVRRVVERERNHHTRLAGIYGADAAIKATSIMMDTASFGIPTVSAVVTPLAGFAKAMAMLSLRVHLLGRDFYEKYKANRILGQSSSVALSADLFEKCPILGCYFLACSNTSDVINFVVDDIGCSGWKFDVEKLVRDSIAPMIEVAREAIGDSRLEVDGLQMSKGAVGATVSGDYGVSNAKNRAKKMVLTKLSAVLPFIDRPELKPVTSKVGVGSSPQVPQGRIYGIGARA